MEEIYQLDHTVGYFQVDHQHRIRLGALFQLLQEAAIHHANQYAIGTGIMEKKGESWILNRVAMQLNRYPLLEEAITIRTWATGMSRYKGFRDFRIFVEDKQIGQVSTLWLYINLQKKTFTRLPAEIEEQFLKRPEEVYFAQLDKLRLPRPTATATKTEVSLRYSDIDGNQHVNNAAYMDYIQTALYNQQLGTRPRTLQIQFSREITTSAATIAIQLESQDSDYCFGIGTRKQLAAFGKLS